MVKPCTKSCRSLYQTVAHLVADPGTSCTRPWHILYQILAHLVPDLGTSCTIPCQTLYQTLSHLVPDLVTPCTRPCHTLYQTQPTPCTGTPRAGGRAKPGPTRVESIPRLDFFLIGKSNLIVTINLITNDN